MRQVFEKNLEAYVARKVRRQLKREGFHVACCMVAALTREMDLEGAIRGKSWNDAERQGGAVSARGVRQN
jgi:hypothetical protein